ncbi:MAG: hypothetical protein AMJ65_15175 [Phycisphaerae bacterium SG8_4]|nr:MAG: hypothetical protein AMJ65_15175 [Phycisphaerae bacterium SG8_4]
MEPQPDAPPPPPSAETQLFRGSAEVAEAGTEPIPWEAWKQFGFFTALWLTWNDSVFRPVSFFRRMPPRSGIGPALGYTVLITVVGFFFSMYWGSVEGALSGSGDEGVLFTLAGNLATLLFGLAFMIPLYVGVLFVTVAIVHVGFAVVGAGRRGYEATFRAVAYSSGPAVFSIFPFFGPYLSLVWGMVLLYIAVREVQRTTNARATLGFLVPLLAFLVFIIFLGFLFELLISSVDLGQTI